MSLAGSRQINICYQPEFVSLLVVCMYSVAQLFPTLCDPVNCDPPGSSVGEGNGTPLQYSCLENPMDEGAWWAAVHGVAKSWTRLHFHFSLLCIGEGNGNTVFLLEEPQGRGSLVSFRLWGHTESDMTEAT